MNRRRYRRVKATASESYSAMLLTGVESQETFGNIDAIPEVAS